MEATAEHHDAPTSAIAENHAVVNPSDSPNHGGPRLISSFAMPSNHVVVMKSTGALQSGTRSLSSYATYTNHGTDVDPTAEHLDAPRRPPTFEMSETLVAETKVGARPQGAPSEL